MQVDCVWGGNLYFEGKTGPFTVAMDTESPVGTDRAANPKQLLLMSICGCASMDVVSLLKKWKEPLEKHSVHADAPTTTGQPSIFSEIILTFSLEGAIQVDKALEAVKLSMTKYCGVSAMVFKTSPIRYEVLLNNNKIGAGVAKFELPAQEA